jgi:hypothetical protein
LLIHRGLALRRGGNALSDLGLRRLCVLYPADRRYSLDRRITVVPLADLAASPDDILIPGRTARR